MRISSLFGQGPVFSLEVCPPKNETEQARLWETLSSLASCNPGFVSVTYGAGGSTRSQTIQVAGEIKRTFGLEPLVHLACIGHTVTEVRELLNAIQAAGLENILCLRGDRPHEHSALEICEFSFASDLVQLVRGGSWPVDVGGACYPECHSESIDVDTDLRHLKLKVEAGVDFLITQLFFDNQHYFDLVRRARAVGISVPIIPGILPVTNVSTAERFISFCGVSAPSEFTAALARHRHEPEAVFEIGVKHAIKQCQGLLEAGAPGIHFFTLNRARATKAILEVIKK